MEKQRSGKKSAMVVMATFQVSSSKHERFYELNERSSFFPVPNMDKKKKRLDRFVSSTIRPVSVASIEIPIVSNWILI